MLVTYRITRRVRAVCDENCVNSNKQRFYWANALSINCGIMAFPSIALLTIHTTMASYTILIAITIPSFTFTLTIGTQSCTTTSHAWIPFLYRLCRTCSNSWP